VKLQSPCQTDEKWQEKFFLPNEKKTAEKPKHFSSRSFLTVQA